MWLIQLKPENLVPANYEDINFPPAFRAFKPIIFKESQLFCCLLGPNTRQGIYGFGQTPKDALTQWDEEFKKRVKTHEKSDKTARFVIHKIKSLQDPKNEVPRYRA